MHTSDLYTHTVHKKLLEPYLLLLSFLLKKIKNKIRTLSNSVAHTSLRSPKVILLQVLSERKRRNLLLVVNQKFWLKHWKKSTNIPWIYSSKDLEGNNSHNYLNLISKSVPNYKMLSLLNVKICLIRKEYKVLNLKNTFLSTRHSHRKQKPFLKVISDISVL